MVAKQKYIIQQRGYYLGGKGYAGGFCRKLKLAPGRVYGNLKAAIRDAKLLSENNPNGGSSWCMRS